MTGDISLPSNPLSSPRAASSPNRTKTNRDGLSLINILTKLHHRACGSSWDQLSSSEVTQENLRLTPPPYSIDQHQTQRNKTLNSSSILIYFSNTKNKGMMSSAGYIGLADVAINQAVANEGWIVRYLPYAPRFHQIICKKTWHKKMWFQLAPNETLYHPTNPH